jgi:serine/threonine protein kinase
MHYTHILHRDLKTQNIFLLGNGRLVLGDLGISKVIDGTMDFAKTWIGTPYCMSPEIFKNKAYNQKFNVWALGCVLYEMITRSMRTHWSRGQDHQRALPLRELEIQRVFARAGERDAHDKPSIAPRYGRYPPESLLPEAYPELSLGHRLLSRLIPEMLECKKRAESEYCNKHEQHREIVETVRIREVALEKTA